MYTKDGFYKALEQKLGDDAYLLLANGGHKKLADLLTAASLTADGNSTKLSVTVGGTTKTGSVTVPYSSNADKVDGIHANGLLTAATLGASGNGTTISVTVGGTTKTGSVIVPYATNSDTVDGYHITNLKTVIRNTKQINVSSGAGWYRILDCTSYSMSFFITFYGSYNYQPPTPVTYLVSHSYNTTAISQIGKSAYGGWIQAIRAVHHDTYKFYIDVKFGVSGTNASNEVAFEVTPMDNRYTSFSLIDYTKQSDGNENAICNTSTSFNVDYASSAGNSDTVDSYHANRFAFTYNSANYNGSSGLTITDLVTGGVSNASHGMIYPATDNPVGTSNWVHVWSQQWTIGSTANWVSQIALGVQQGTGMWYRTYSGNIVGRGWTRVLDSSNYTSYTVTKTGGGASGTWSINVTGSAGSVAWGNVSNKPSNIFCYQGNVSTAYVNGTTYSTLSSGTYYIQYSGYTDSMIHFQHGSSSSGLDIKFNYTQGADAPLYYRKCVDSNRFASTSWVALIDSLNIGSQSVNYANSAGNADKVDGLHSNEFAKSLSKETTMKEVAQNYNSTLGMIYGSDVPSGSKGWWHLWQANYNNNPGGSGNTNNFWCSQIVNAPGTTDPYIRSRSGGNDINTGWTGWVRILTSSNWTNVISVNNASLTLQTAGTTQTTFYANDSTNRTFNVTCANIGAAPAHNHPYVHAYSGTDVNPSTTHGYWHAMTTQSGITGDWWHIIHMDWTGDANWRSELALPTQHRTGVYYRSDNWNWSSWIMLLDTSSTSQTKSGNLTCANFYVTSDRTKKTNIESIASIVPIRKFNWKENGSLSYGFIAQELVELGHEELVHGTEGNMTVNYDAALSFSMAKLSNYVETLEHTIEELKNENNNLKSKIEDLYKLIVK